MPKALLEYMGYCIYFWIGDGEEPVHVHVSKKKTAARRHEVLGHV